MCYNVRAITGAVKGAVQGAQDGLLSGMVMGGIGGAMNPSFCFVAGTAVLTTLGKKAIETIQVGDVIPCVDHITGEAAEKKVISTSVNKVNRLIELDIDGEIIQCTETHPFQVKGRGWVNACDLNPGDIVYTKDWNTAVVKSVGLLELDEPVEVFNFEVEDCHTYFVGDNYILVHNASCFNPKKTSTKKVTLDNGRTAYLQGKGSPYAGKYISPDKFGHGGAFHPNGGSAYKLLEPMSGSKVRLIGDLDATGNLMSKHSSNLYEIYKIISG